MSFLAVLLALAIEQLRPLPRRNGIHDGLVGWTEWAGRNFDAGRDHHAWVVWAIGSVVPALAVWGVHAALAHFSLLLAAAWDVGVLYLTLGFRQFSHYFTDIRQALERGDDLQARRLLQQWRGLDAADLPRDELLRHVIEHSLLAAHRHVFGVFFWFVLLSTLGLGPAGAVFYRVAEFSSRYWSYRGGALGVPINDRLRRRATRLFELIDFVPSRLTAFGFAVVGDFEEAVACWRRDSVLWRLPNDGIVLASAAGAVGVRLGGSPPKAPSMRRSTAPPMGPATTRSSGLGASIETSPTAPAARLPDRLPDRAPSPVLNRMPGHIGDPLGDPLADDTPDDTPDRGTGFEAGTRFEDIDAAGSTPGLTPEIGHLRSVVGLVWRSVVLWMLLLLLLSLARLVG